MNELEGNPQGTSRCVTLPRLVGTLASVLTKYFDELETIQLASTAGYTSQMLTVGSSLPSVVPPNQRADLVDCAQLHGRRIPSVVSPTAKTGAVEHAWYTISPAETAEKLLEAVGK